MGDFAENLKRIRTEMGLSQDEFAKLLKTSKQNISRYELRQVSPKISTAAKLADILNISLSELNGEEGWANEVELSYNSHPNDAPVNNLAQHSDSSRKRRKIADLLAQLPDDKADLVIAILESILADAHR